MSSQTKKPIHRFNNFLDHYILPWPVRFLTSRLVILATISLLIPLILWAKNTVMVLAVNSYLNTMSVAVSSIVLLYATISEFRQKQIAELQEKRAMEDHLHVTETHTLILKTLQNQRKEMAELRLLLETMTGQKMAEIPQMESPDVKTLHTLGLERYNLDKLNERIETKLQQNHLVTEIRKDFQTILNEE